MKTSHVEAGIEEMGYEIQDGMGGVEIPVSIPAQFTCADPTPNLDRFDLALQARDMTRLPDRGVIESDVTDEWVFETEVLIKEKYKRLTVKIWHDGCVRIYPREDAPTVGQFAQLTKAIELGFQTYLEHEPLNDE